MDLEKIEQIRKKHNLEILYVFPYGRDTVKQWLEVLPDQLAKVKTWKNPAEPDKLDEKGRRLMERSRKAFPKDLSIEKGKVEAPFPILLDEDRKLTKGLGLFMTEWGGSKVDQLIPSVFLIDRQGVVQFKYLGQNTWDRPGWDYLMRILKAVESGD